MPTKKNRIVCLCNGVKETEILHILKKGAQNVDEIAKFTLASTGCGKCRVEIKALLDHYLNSKKPDFQHKIEF